MIIWELSNDVWEERKSIIKTLYKKSGNPEKTPLPVNFSGWMEQYFHVLGDRKLSEIALPGSHDAGMYKTRDCSPVPGAGDCNTKTQALSIAEQLDSGIRYFDLRPVYKEVFSTPSECKKSCSEYLDACVDSCDPLSDPGCEARCQTDYTSCVEGCNTLEEPFDTGHFDTPSQGCLGGSFNEVLGDVAKFAEAQPKDLVILKFSHYLNATESSFGFSEKIKHKLTKKVTAALGTHLVKYKEEVNLLSLKLKEILKMGSVIALFDDEDDTPSDWPNGILKSDQLKIYDKYSDTNDFEEMAEDQFQKLKDPDNRKNKLFLLSWTLTQSYTEAATCSLENPLIPIPSIEALANLANENLEQVLDEENTGGKLFNILYTDYCDTVPTKICLNANGLL